MSEFKQLIEYFKKLPGVGPRQATRFVLSLLKQSKEELADFGNAIASLKDQVKICKQCFNLADEELCSVCRDDNRDNNTICVVEKITDAESIEKTGQYKGLYHILGGTINPAEQVLPENLKIKELLTRINPKTEVILATNPGVHGEATALYLEEQLGYRNIKTTRLGRGLASGTALEYADDSTLINALRNRK
jgi:recombination protein RecR